MRGGLDVQHRPLFFADVRVVAAERSTCEAVAAALRTQGAENRLVERGTTIRQALRRRARPGPTGMVRGRDVAKGSERLRASRAARSPVAQ